MKKALLKVEKNKFILLLLLFSMISFSQVTIKSQGFESAASDNLNYSVSSATNVTTSTTTSMSGARSLRFATGDRNVVFENVDISGFTSVQVSIAFAATGVDNSEDLFVDFSYDNGGSYPTTVQLVDGTSGSGGQNLAFGVGDGAPGQSSNPYVFSVPGGNNSIRVRVRSIGLDSGEFYYIDNVVIRGVGSPEINLQGNGNDIVSGSTAISTTINTDFGSTDINSGSVNRTYTVQNTGTANLTISSVYTNSGDFSASISSGTIVPGGTATLTVTFNPTNAGTRTGIAYLSNSDSDEPTYGFAVEGIGTEQEINIQGGSPLTNIPNGSTLISSSINTDFGTSAGTRTYTIQNLGTSNLTLSSAWSSLTDYTITYSPSTVTPGGTATLTVVFNPTGTGTRTATISLSNNDADEGTYSFNVSAVVSAQEINVQGNGINILTGSTAYSTANNTDFGSIAFGSGTIVKTFTIQNTGGFPLSIWSVYDNSGEYSVSSSASTVAPGGTATLTVTFSPTSAGTKSATISISNNDSNEGTYTFNVTANSFTASPEINIQGGAGPSDIASGSTVVSDALGTNFGTTPGTRTYTIQNLGTSNLTISSVSSSLGDYTVSVSPSVIAPGNSGTLTVVFNPSVTGARTSTITINNNDTNEGTYTFRVSGNVPNREINLRGNGINIASGSTTINVDRNTDFGSQDVNTGSITKTFSIENTGGFSLTISSVTSSSSDFIVSFPATTIEPGDTAVLDVTFDPTIVGTRNGVITINNDDSNEATYTFAVRGIGTEQEINLQGGAGPSNIVNGSTNISTTLGTNFGTMPGTRTYIIQNTGTSDLVLYSVSSSLSDYTVSVSPSIVSPGSTATLTVTFSPTASGTRLSTITINNNDSDESSYTFNVSANATDKEINVRGNGMTISTGSTIINSDRNTDFGSVQVDGGIGSNSFTIENLGAIDLTISSISTNSAEYTTTFTSAVIPSGGSTTFTIDFNPNTNGVRNAVVTILNDDSNESTYMFNISGRGLKDSDGDGIDDSIDLDDDNDGIRDTIECGTCLSDPFVNGSFESPVIAASSYAILPTSSVPGWQTSAENFIEIWSSGFNGVPAASGNQFAELNANVPGTLYQTFCLNGAGGTINWSIKHRGRGGEDQAFVKFGPSLAAALASAPVVTMVDGTDAWGTYSGIYTIPVGQRQIVLTFQAGYTGSGSASVGNFIDDVQIVINQGCIDSDGDGIPDIEDLDSDNDGIPDIEEARFQQYSNGTATFDMTNPSNWMDTNSNGLNDYIASLISAGTYVVPDTDGDGLRNYLDFDSDNDSLFDVDEAGLINGDGDINGDGKGDGIDTDKDGILDIYDNSTNFGTIARIYTQDTDSDGTPDFLELDSNNDGIFDIQTGLYGSFDANNDGRIDGSGDVDFDGILDTFDTDITVKGSPRDLNRKLYLEFDGRNDYGEGTSVLGGLANASLMAWIDLASDFSSNGVIVGQGNFLLRVNASRQLQVILNSTTLTCTTTTLNTSRWYHVAAVYNGSSLKLYINGSEVASTSVSGSLNANTNPLTIGKQPAGSIRYFKGKIDEIRVFNVALTPTQLQRMVYQEIENNSSQVRGAIVPRDIEALPYANLLRYYRMDAYKDDIIDDLTTPGIDIGSGMKIYNNKVINYQQAPMPFETRTTGTFATAVNDVTRDIYGMDVIDYDYSIIRVQHNITETANHTNMAMFVNNGVTVNMTNDNKLQNDWYLKLDGKIDLVGKSQLVQSTNSELDVTSTGSIERDQQGQSNRFNYNYWSSPVSSINNSTINHGYTVAGVMKDGTNPDSIQNINWTTALNSSATSPITLSSYWLYKFQDVGNNYYNWSSVGQNGTLLAGQGYTLKGSNAISANQNYTFVGKPNNGNITTPVGANNLMLAGNPYPSAIDAEEFINDNLSTITGTLYFWEHYSTNTSHNTIQYQGGYATINLTGSTAPSAPVIVSGLGSSTKEPGRFIPVGQGFFVTGNATGGTLTFENDQRIFIKENNAQSNTLFRTNNSQATPNAAFNNSEDTYEDEQFMKLKLGFKSNNNYYRQILIGFMNDKATSAIDPGYDAKHLDDKPNDMYFMHNTTKLNIQGDGYFNINNIYPLGVKVAAAGNTTIGIDKKENFDSDIDIYIFDNVTNTYNSIKDNPFVISLPAGTYENRFSLRFVDTNSLAVGDVDLQKGISVTNSQANSTINIKNQLMETTIKSVMLFNMLGQQITSWDVESIDQASIELPTNTISTGAYIVKVNTENGSISKKILIK